MKQKIIYLISLSLLLLFACNNKDDDPILSAYDIKRNNILGNWNMEISTREFRADTLHAEYGSLYDMEYSFNSDGTGYTRYLSFENQFEWLFQYDPQQIVLKNKIFPLTRLYDITKNEQDRQIWEIEITTTDSTGAEILLKQTLKFNR